MTEYVKIQGGNLLDAFDQVEQMIEGLQDVEDDWQHNVKEINKKIMASAVKNGITKGEHQKFKFKVFDIADMYRQKDGSLCYPCQRGKFCRKHKLEKKERMNEEDFERE
jgi:hypothetical protein